MSAPNADNANDTKNPNNNNTNSTNNKNNSADDTKVDAKHDTDVLDTSIDVLADIDDSDTDTDTDDESIVQVYDILPPNASQENIDLHANVCV